MKKILLLLAIAGTLFSCKKESSGGLTPQPAPALTDASEILLKDITSPATPNPYFHFTYDSLRFVKEISFASNLTKYTVEYENKRVKRLINTISENKMEYTYSNGNVSEINEFSGITGNRIFLYHFSYNNSRQLVQVTWTDFFNNNEPSIFRKAELAYHPDGNLATVNRYYRNDNTGALEWQMTYTYSDYDNQKNVDGFYLLHDFFDSFLFLPQVKLQKNNCRKETRHSATNDFDLQSVYTIVNGLPVKEEGVMKVKSGNGPIQSFPFSSVFSYY